MAVCRICSGELELRIRGNGAALTAAHFSPSAHQVGQHGDLLECRECGTIQQPVLPQGEALHALYREMRDDEYLAEEEGRRATANRLLDLRSEEHTSELQSRQYLVCRLLLEK